MAEKGLLTNQEMEVLKRVGSGMSNKQIADAFCLSKRTVDFHLANAYRKLNASNRVSALRRATQLGLLELEILID